MKTVFVLLVCLLSCELGGCMRASGSGDAAQMRSAPLPARATNTSAKLPANTLILGVN